MILSHLCYASGNAEDGMPDGTRDQALARVDNYAAGFVRAGARAVVAEGHLGPAYYVDALLASARSVEDIWRRAPSGHGHESTAPSRRSAGFTLHVDPDTANRGYYRSLVVRPGVRAADVRAGPVEGVTTGGEGRGTIATPPEPGPRSLATLHLSFDAPLVSVTPIAGSPARLVLPLPAADRGRLPPGTMVGVRWEPITLAPLPAPASGGRDAAGAGSPGRGHAGARKPGLSAEAPGPSAPSAPEDAAAPAVVVPEEPATVVEPVAGRADPAGLAIEATAPPRPGLYRLSTTLHDATGVAYDAATQALVPSVLVRVAGAGGVAFGVPPTLDARPGSTVRLLVAVSNIGSARWDGTVGAERTRPTADRRLPPARPRPSRLVAAWVPLDGAPAPPATRTVLPVALSRPGASARVEVALTTPEPPGSYLLVLDVETPAHGSLAALGNDPGLVRVTIGPG